MGVAGKDKHPHTSGGQTEEEKLFHEWLERLDPFEVRLKKEQRPVRKSPQESKRIAKNRLKLDLHGLTLAGAAKKLEDCIESILAQNLETELMVITGKGIRSSGPPVLAREAWEFVVNRYRSRIERIDSCPADVLLGGIPIRGHFVVVFKR